MSDRVAVLNKGRLQQVGPPHEIYEAPTNPFVADFIGESNILAGIVDAESGGVMCVRLERGPTVQVAGRSDFSMRIGQRVRIMVRPERFFDLGAVETPPVVNSIQGLVAECAYIGVSDKYRITTPEGLAILVRLPSGPSSRRYRPGEPIAAGFHIADARLIEAGDEARTRTSDL